MNRNDHDAMQQLKHAKVCIVPTWDEIEKSSGTLEISYHPLLASNSVLGKEILYLGSGDSETTKIIGLGWKLSTMDLIDKLLKYDSFYAHDWKKGDLLIWDND